MKDPEDKANGIRKAEVASGRWRDGWEGRQKSLTRDDRVKRFRMGNRLDHFLNE